MKRLQHLLFIGMLLIIALSSCKKSSSTTGKTNTPPPLKMKNNTNSFAEVIKLAPDKQLKKELSNFEKSGIQKPLNINTTPNKLIAEARKYMGTPHVMGGLSQRGIDCSGLLVMAFKKFGVQLPHNSEAIARYGQIVPIREQLERGDLVFFTRTYNTPNVITHAGIYLGDGKFLHTSSSKGVTVSNLDDPYYWQPKYVFGTRFF